MRLPKIIDTIPTEVVIAYAKAINPEIALYRSEGAWYTHDLRCFRITESEALELFFDDFAIADGDYGDEPTDLRGRILNISIDYVDYLELDILIPLLIKWYSKSETADCKFVEIPAGAKYLYDICGEDERYLALVLESDIHWYTAN